MRFQALTWSYVDKFPQKSRPSDSGWQTRWNEATSLLHVCGRDQAGESVHVCVLDHRPVFYVSAAESAFYAEAAKATNFSKAWEPWWVSETEVVHKDIFQGFRGGATTPVLRVVAANRGCAAAMARALHAGGVETFNTCVDPVTAFFHATGIQSCGWIEVLEFSETDLRGYEPSRCEHDFVCRTSGVTAYACNDVADFLFASVDIEAVSVADADGRYPFPDGDRRENPASCVCVQLQRLHGDAVELHAFSFDEVDIAYIREHSPDMVVHEFRNEALMWHALVAWFSAVQVDVIVGWNILNFDMKFFHKRCQLHGVDLRSMGKYDVYSTKLKERTLSTGGAGHHEFHYWDIAGVFLLDGYVIVKRDYKLTSYNLGAVGEHFIGLSKIDLSPKEIFRESVSGPSGLSRVIVYCARDVDVPMKIVRKLSSFIKLVQFANMAFVSIDDLQLRGANCKTLSLLAHEANRKQWIISDRKFSFNSLHGKYQGALVLDPVQGLHSDAPVVTLDFKSLYPSMIISQCLCPHTFVEDEQYLGLPGVAYKTFSWEDAVTRRRHVYHFAVNQESLTPGVLQRLAKERDNAKREMKKCTAQAIEKRREAESAGDEAHRAAAEAAARAAEFDVTVWDGIQLSVKLLMNSIYGFFGAAQVGKVPHVPIAMVITYMGREMLTQTQKYILCKYGSTPLLPPVDERTEAQVRAHCHAVELNALTQSVTGVQNVYGDTDSVFVKFVVPAEHSADRADMLRWAFERAEHAAESTTAFLRDTMCPGDSESRNAVELEFEKALFPTVCYSKKRYAFLKHVRIGEPGKIGAMGLQLVRRDLCTASKNLMWETITAVLQRGDVSLAERMVVDALERLCDRSTPLSDLSCSKKLSHQYAGTPPAHANVAALRRGRGEDVVDGDRVDFIFVVDEGRIQSERVEDPKYVEEAGLAVDYAAIVEKQFKKPVCDLLQPVLPHLSVVFDRYIARLSALQRPQQRKVEQRTKRMRPITDWLTTTTPASCSEHVC